MKINLKVWRQSDPLAVGGFVNYSVEAVEPDLSFLEMLDMLNEQLITQGEVPIEFDHDCREGICGTCGMMINGRAHGPQKRTAACQLYMRHFDEGETVTLEPWRATAFPVIKDLVVDRSAFDRIMMAGGYVSIKTGAAPDANAVLVDKPNADKAFDYATCIGCGACVAACPNASASLFTAAKISHLALLAQGKPERKQRVVKMTKQMTAEGFGDCSNHGECQSVCPQGISIDAIAQMRREYIRAKLPFG
ncbi:succinate dehydrogenase and fumarate reductase iron-sulfur protein [Synechococcus sp. PCC 7335]|uniref:succinate dehydrogenase/fumarate reductase iron-sulfur subunit n=1 Tax=Synechococcus sp. (strain ATCC 29403 / PCC 7335) TaxID=91464 RepID=UPI00017ED61F|nr:succinate dehydrogenase/fumarate reductase iron-sulfur subunit [Synechococcus sp. PCC 7335]EDX86697.1 succinate dehydrogenase and fumarate reductase iron-sulfur protein [Synechococcus sp. PCC 7335]